MNSRAEPVDNRFPPLIPRNLVDADRGTVRIKRNGLTATADDNPGNRCIAGRYCVFRDKYLMGIDPELTGDSQFIFSGFLDARDRFSIRPFDITGVGKVVHFITISDVYDPVVRNFRDPFTRGIADIEIAYEPTLTVAPVKTEHLRAVDYQR
jgi:hypothetical protein